MGGIFVVVVVVLSFSRLGPVANAAWKQFASKTCLCFDYLLEDALFKECFFFRKGRSRVMLEIA
jgi:hypothetical protein